MAHAHALDPEPEHPHDFGRIEELDAGLILHCRCGWASPVGRTGESVGTAWDRHRWEVAGRSR